MNVADLDLCRELYEVSGWEDTEFLWDYKGVLCRPLEKHPLADEYPAYDLGYLLRKLGDGTDIIYHESESDAASIHGIRAKADTPEDAACKLAIELFKQGVLK